MPLVDSDTVGAVRSIELSVTVVLAVILPTYTLEYVPLNLQEAESAISAAAPELLWFTLTV